MYRIQTVVPTRFSGAVQNSAGGHSSTECNVSQCLVREESRDNIVQGKTTAAQRTKCSPSYCHYISGSMHSRLKQVDREGELTCITSSTVSGSRQIGPVGCMLTIVVAYLMWVIGWLVDRTDKVIVICACHHPIVSSSGVGSTQKLTFGCNRCIVVTRLSICCHVAIFGYMEVIDLVAVLILPRVVGRHGVGAALERITTRTVSHRSRSPLGVSVKWTAIGAGFGG